MRHEQDLFNKKGLQGLGNARLLFVWQCIKTCSNVVGWKIKKKRQEGKARGRSSQNICSGEEQNDRMSSERGEVIIPQSSLYSQIHAHR